MSARRRLFTNRHPNASVMNTIKPFGVVPSAGLVMYTFRPCMTSSFPVVSPSWTVPPTQREQDILRIELMVGNRQKSDVLKAASSKIVKDKGIGKG